MSLSITEYALAAGIREKVAYDLAHKSKAAKDGQWRKVNGAWAYFGEPPQGFIEKGAVEDDSRRSEPPPPATAPRKVNPLDDKFEDRASVESLREIANALDDSTGDTANDGGIDDDSSGNDDAANVADVLEVIEENFPRSTSRFHVPARLKGWRVPYGQYVVFALAVGFFVLSYLRERANRGKEQDRQNNTIGYREDALPGSMRSPITESNKPRVARDSAQVGETSRAGGFTTLDY